jgi:dTDP-glucose 4,6-dehydratase
MNNGALGDSYHISTNSLVSIYEMVESIAGILNVEISDLIEHVPERPGKDFAYQLSTEKIRSELGWKDSISLENGLLETIEWARMNLSALTKLPKFYEHKR